jgi:hypothetical protein
MAAENPPWGAERIRGGLGKLGISVAKRIIQTYLRGNHVPRPRGQSWATFLHNHAAEIWACVFLPVTDLLFRPLFASFAIELATRRVVHVGATATRPTPGRRSSRAKPFRSGSTRAP